MAAKDTKETAPKTRKPRASKSLKIKSTREKQKTKREKKTSRKSALKIKALKPSRTIRKIRAIAKKALKTATKGLELNRLPLKVYKAVDTAISKNEAVTTAIQEAVIAAVNGLKPASTNDKVRKARKKKVAVTETAPVTA